MDLIDIYESMIQSIVVDSPLIATTCTPFSRAHRNTSRPIRPKPLMPTFTSDEAMFVLFCVWMNFNCVKRMSDVDVDCRDRNSSVFFFVCVCVSRFDAWRPLSFLLFRISEEMKEKKLSKNFAWESLCLVRVEVRSALLIGDAFRFLIVWCIHLSISIEYSRKNSPRVSRRREEWIDIRDECRGSYFDVAIGLFANSTG